MEKLNSSESRDRLSELPDSLILVILSLLPMKDVVRTTLLSNRWKDLWTTIPCLHFSRDIKDFDDENEDDVVRLRNFVNRALLLWKGTKILKFIVELSYWEEPASSDLDLWLRLAIENEVEELEVNLLKNWGVTKGFINTGYSAPQRLYSCLSIKKLSLAGCQLKIHGNLQWKQLKCLTIDGVRLSQHVIDEVLSGTPQLEVLILRFLESNENLNIHSSSLKELTLEKFVDEKSILSNADDGARDTVLTIWAPNVETLEILGILYSKCVLMNVSSLANATVNFDYVQDPEKSLLYGCKLFEDILGQVHRTNRHVEQVSLSYWFIKLLGEMKKRDMRMLATLSNAKFLKLRAKEVDEIMGLLEIFAKLTTLTLTDRNPLRNAYRHFFEIRGDIREPFVTKFDAENTLESKTDFPKSCLLHLTMVEIAWIDTDESILSFIEFLLKYASKLEKLVFQVPFGPDSSMLLATEKLLRMPRSSPTAEVILLRK